ncbi:hypothetical protein As57867_004824, partial [Aphanomyces stellatus]
LLPSGDFEILGRQDNQVKLKGYRIELDEVAEAMMQHPNVVAAAAIVKDKSHLVGYFTPAHINNEALKDTVAARLPVYMVPAVWIGLDAMPLTVNGKIDKRALEALDVIMDIEFLATPTERQMARVWSQVLDVDLSCIGRQTSFIALGGDSLTAIKVVSACTQVGLRLTATHLLQTMVLSRVASLVYLVDETNIHEWPSVAVADDVTATIRDEYSQTLALETFQVYPLPPLQAGMVYATINDRTQYLYQHTLVVQDDAVDASALRLALGRLLRQYEILRTTFVTTAHGLHQVIRSSTSANVDDAFAVVDAASLDAFLHQDRARGFEIGDKYFLRLTLVTCQDTRMAVWTIHHALYDGWSLSLFMEDFFTSLHGVNPPARPPYRMLVDYVHAQDSVATEAYWRKYLQGIEPSLVGATSDKHATAEMTDDDALVLTAMKTSLHEVTRAAHVAGVTVAELLVL